MPLVEKSFNELVDDQINAMQGVAQQLLNFNTGSVFRAFIESNAGNSLWLESIVAFLLSVTRLQTSQGNDVDTFVEQFQLYRIPATPAFGIVTFSRNDTSQAAVIPAGTFDTTVQGALVYASANGVSYSVYADSDNPNYDPTLNSYVIPVGISSADVPVVALMPGAVGNVLAGLINTISSPLPYVSTVTNPESFDNGEDQETDAALKARFVLYINSLSKAVEQALEEAIESVLGVARYLLVENEDILGNDYVGFFYVVVDDGTGNASSQLLGNVQAAVYATRGFTIAFSVYAPIAVPIDIVAHVFTDGSVPDSNVQSAVVTALQNYISTRNFNSLYAWSDIPRVIYEANNTFVGAQNLSPIINVTNWTQNSLTSDLVLAGREIGVPGTITVIMNA